MHGVTMLNKLRLCFLLATVVSCLLSHVVCQQNDALEAPKTVKCKTHDLKAWICSWNDTNLKTTSYDVCYWTSGPPKCIPAQDTSVAFNFDSFAKYKVKIIAKNGIETADRTFEVSEADVPFVPYEPQILRLTPDYATSSLFAEWNGNASSFIGEVEARWEIEFLRTDTMEVAGTVLLTTTWTQESQVFHYNWTSDVPLVCTSHSVRIRCYMDEYYNDNKEWSDWSQLATVPGSTEGLVFPVDAVMAVGSNVTFCCFDPVKNVTSFTVGNDEYPRIHLGNNSSAIKVYNMKVSQPSGTNVICNYGELGTVVFVGYPPDVPQQLNCETRLFDVITCGWNVGRLTRLYSDHRETKYSLHERFSNETVHCGSPPPDIETFQCTFKIIENENLYNFILWASNPLGQSQSALSIDVRQRVFPKAPENLHVSNGSPRNVTLSWLLPGNFSLLKLICQIETRSTIRGLELSNISLSGQAESSYSASVNNLHPFTTYVFRVRCAAFEHFWKWSEWCDGKTHTTPEARNDPQGPRGEKEDREGDRGKKNRRKGKCLNAQIRRKIQRGPHTWCWSPSLLSSSPS